MEEENGPHNYKNSSFIFALIVYILHFLFQFKNPHILLSVALKLQNHSSNKKLPIFIQGKHEDDTNY